MNRKKEALLSLLCCLMLLMLTACSNGGQPAGETAAPSMTVNPAVPDAVQQALKAVLASAQEADGLNLRVKNGLGQITSLSVPGQIARDITQAASEETSLSPENGWYSFSRSSSGRYSFQKPLAAVMMEEQADSYVISDDGEPRETQEAAFYDPLDYVMSGEGGGQFAFASYYLIREDGQCAETENVSRLNDAVSGYSRDTFLRENGTLYFADIQLIPRVDTGEDPAQSVWAWRLCVGTVRGAEAEVREYDLETAELAVPDIFPDLRGQGSAAVTQLMERPGPLVSLSVKNGTATLTDLSGTRSAQLR